MNRRNDNLELVLSGWIDARRRRDFDTIERHLHPDVVWQGLRPDLVCGNRAAVLDNVRSSDGWLPDVSGIELHADGDQVMLGVRSPDLIEIADERLDGEIYDVFTIIDGLIVRMDEYRTRDDALDAIRARLAQTAAPADALQRMPPAPVEDLIRSSTSPTSSARSPTTSYSASRSALPTARRTGSTGRRSSTNKQS